MASLITTWKARRSVRQCGWLKESPKEPHLIPEACRLWESHQAYKCRV